MKTASKVTEIYERVQQALNRAMMAVVTDNPRAATDLQQIEGLRYLLRTFAAGLVSQIEAHDPAYPYFFKILSPWLNWGYPNPDGTYAFTFLDGAHTYRLYGTRGTARLFDVEVWEGDIADLRNAQSFGGRRSINGGKSEIDVNEDGSFEIVLSREEQPANWIPLPLGLAHLYVRQWYYDYESESPGELYIERDDATFPRPPITSANLEESFDRLIQMIDTVFQPLAMGVEAHFSAPMGTVPFPTELLASEGDGGGSIAFRNQVYGRGHFECGPDEAVVLEVEPPKAEYWMFGLLSPFWESFDFMGHQISVNGHQAHIDTDGQFRAVIAHTDPGVPNWLDACGHGSGLIGGRYNWSEDVPVPQLTTVPLADLRSHLPADTPTVTLAERSELLRRRFLSQQRRRVAW